MRTLHRAAWASAGRAFRLVQLMRLHEIDSPTKPPVPERDTIETEEKRRVFWMAYFLDHLLSMRNNWPITLNEHVVRLQFLHLTARKTLPRQIRSDEQFIDLHPFAGCGHRLPERPAGLRCVSIGSDHRHYTTEVIAIQRMPGPSNHLRA